MASGILGYVLAQYVGSMSRTAALVRWKAGRERDAYSLFIFRFCFPLFILFFLLAFHF